MSLMFIFDKIKNSEEEVEKKVFYPTIEHKSQQQQTRS